MCFAAQKNLRGRVAHVSLDRDGDESYDHATHYTYDIHGNVDTLIQDNPELATYGHQFKKIEYEYDLVSGNVNQVTYQKGEKDQFMHRYTYDADNRITQVLTSTNGLVWEKDAKYFYYRHGPLARVEVGNDKVQGIDYAYTLQGWLKGVNSDNLTKEYDQGKDSKSASTYMASNGDIHRMVAGDAFGFSLGYFVNDYQYIARTSTPTINSFYSETSSVSNLSSNAPELYNGNIRMMVTSVYDKPPLPQQPQPQPQLTGYTYDQLNRITGMTSLPSSALTINSWSGALGNKYQSEYTYDGNGNLLTLKRRDNAGTLMDDFSYKQDWVDPGDHAKGKASNRLLSLTDPTDASIATGDIDGNIYYDYDLIGNLIQEDDDRIETNIHWTNYGKVRSVERNYLMVSYASADLYFKYDALGNRISKKVLPRSLQGVPNTSLEEFTYYVHDAQGNVMATYRLWQGAFYLDEWHIYGSSRLGVKRIDKKFSDIVNQADLSTPAVAPNILGDKYYELSNHLGNVLATVSDRRIQKLSSGTVDYYSADIETSQDYYPGGSLMPGRSFNSNAYRYGYNAGSEKDDEITGVTGSHFTTHFREFDTRILKPWSPDPVFQPWQSPYSYMDGNPILYNDPMGDKVRNKHENAQAEAKKNKNQAQAEFDKLNKGDKGYNKAQRALNKATRDFDRVNELYQATEDAIDYMKTNFKDEFDYLDGLTLGSEVIDVEVEASQMYFYTHTKDPYAPTASEMSDPTVKREAQGFTIVPSKMGGGPVKRNEYGNQYYRVGVTLRLQDSKGVAKTLYHEFRHVFYKTKPWELNGKNEEEQVKKDTGNAFQEN